MGQDFGSDSCSIGEDQATNSERPERKSPQGGRIATYNKKWMGMFDRLVAYKARYNNTMVPYRYDEDPKLASWVSRQRRPYIRNQMLSSRRDLLNSIDFVWNPTGVKEEEQWMEMYEKLVAYKKRYKDTMVPRNYVGDAKLANWVKEQRYQYRNRNLSESRWALLNSIGFIWEDAKATKNQEKWINMYHRLLVYKREHNSTLISPSLGQWVSKQRFEYKTKKLLKERFDLLESIGFVWDPRGYTK